MKPRGLKRVFLSIISLLYGPWVGVCNVSQDGQKGVFPALKRIILKNVRNVQHSRDPRVYRG